MEGQHHSGSIPKQAPPLCLLEWLAHRTRDRGALVSPLMRCRGTAMTSRKYLLVLPVSITGRRHSGLTPTTVRASRGLPQRSLPSKLAATLSGQGQINLRESLAIAVVLTALLPARAEVQRRSPHGLELRAGNSGTQAAIPTTRSRILRERTMWFYEQRTYPLKKTPGGARIQALKQARQVMLSAPQQAVLGTWRLIGP